MVEQLSLKINKENNYKKNINFFIFDSFYNIFIFINIIFNKIKNSSKFGPIISRKIIFSKIKQNPIKKKK